MPRNGWLQRDGEANITWWKVVKPDSKEPYPMS